MDAIIKKVLNEINSSGYEAYLVGGFVRDYLLGIKSLDVDICTNALPKDLHQIFKNNNNANNYGGFNLKIKSYNIDITTYRQELKYAKRKPIEIKYINSLEEDIKRRDFTINAICLDKKDQVIDLVGGVNDLNKRLIRMIGDNHQKIVEDPLRILRAIRFASILNFKIVDDLQEEIKNNYQLVSTLSNKRIKDELTKILLNKNFLVGLNYLKDLKILDLLEISFDDITYVNDISGMWAQLKINRDFEFTKQEKRNIINIRQIISEGNINYKTLYKYGLYNSLVAGEILNINPKLVNKMYHKMPIKDVKDLQISNEEIMELTNLSKENLNKIKKDLIASILDEKLNNNYKEIKNYLINL